MAAAADPQQRLEPREIGDEELQLLSSYTGEADLGALRQHVTSVWRQACSSSSTVYMCIRGLMFLEPRIRSNAHYQQALAEMAAKREAEAAPLWLDVGAAVGTDVRQLRVDGLGEGEVVALDVPSDYWELGLQLYRDAAHPPCPIIWGDITDDGFLPPSATPQPSNGAPPASASAAIRQLVGAVDVASCTAVLHCLGQDKVTQLLSKIALLLKPGGMLLGSTLGAAEPRQWAPAYQADASRWLHSPESLAAALREAGYVDVEVAPTSWKDIETATRMDRVREVMKSYVGERALEDRLMLAFTARKLGAGGAD